MANQTDALIDAALEAGDMAAVNNLVRSLSYILNDATEEVEVQALR